MKNKSSNERRQDTPRLSARMAAKIIAPGQVSPAPCIVTEISPVGAKLNIDSGWILPRNFWLRIDGDRDVHYCTIKWRDGGTVGVDFPSGQHDSLWRHNFSLRQLPSRARV
ncbi:MAG TPA: hypothetical protein VH933_07005 [Aestuariivirgaceae bacterium]|jgi:hypothetical protein